MSDHLDYEINKELGECYLFMGDMDKAEEYYKKAASSNGIHPDPYLGLATVAVQRGDLPKALILYRKAAGIEANDKAMAGMGLVEMELGQHHEALEHFQAALRLNQDNAIAVFGLVQTGFALERLEDVLSSLNEVLDAAPHKNDVRFSVAGCLTKLGRAEAAVAQLEIILQQDPHNGPARELHSRIAADLADQAA